MSVLQMPSVNSRNQTPTREDQTPTREDQREEDQTPTREDQTSTREDQREEDQTPTREDQTPTREDQTPTREDQTPTKEDQRGENQTPKREDQTLTREDQTPTREDQTITLPASAEVHGASPAGLGRSSVTLEGLGRSSVTPEGLGRSSVTPEGLGRSSVTSESLGRSSVTPEGLARSSVTPEGLGRSSVTPEGLGRSSVTPEGLGRSSVTPEGLGRSSVTSEGLGRSSVTLESLGRSSVTPEGLGRSSVTPEGLGRSSVTPTEISLQSFSDATPGDTGKQQHTRQHPVSEQTCTQVDFPPAQMHAGNESSSLTTAGRLVKHLPEIAVNRDREHTDYKMKETEYKIRDQREGNTRQELLQSPCIRDLHNPGEDSHLQERLVQHTQEAMEKCEDSSSHLISAINQYHTSHITQHTSHITHNSLHKGKTVQDVPHSTSYKRTDPSHAEQQSENIPEHRYKDKLRDEAIRIQRPRDYIRQWRDSIDRLSTISVTDDVGAPVSPLISHYSVSFPSRSKSMDAGGYTSAAVSYLEGHYPLAHRSRSSHVLSMTDGSSLHGVTHCSNASKNQHDGMTAVSTSSVRNNPAAAHPGSHIHRRPLKKSHLFSDYMRQSDESDVSETHLIRDNTLATSPPLTSHEEDSHLLRYRNQQTILNKRFRSEPSSSGSRGQFRSVGYQRVSSGAPVWTTSHRHHSLSPQRQAVDLHTHSTARLSADGAWGPHPILSVPANYRPASPQQKWPSTDVRKQEVDSRNIHVSISSEVSPEALTQLADIASQQADPGIKVRLTVSGDSRSLPSIRRGGAGRVPRREAWEQERRHRNENGSVVGSNADTQSGIINVLFKEIKILREKIELLEQNDPESRLDTETQSSSCRIRSVASLTDREDNIQQRYRPLQDNIQQRLLSDHISTPACTGHERALSCPLLKVSRQSHATRSLSRNAVRSGIVETKTAPDSLVANLGLSPRKSDCHSCLVSDPNIFHVPQKSDRRNMHYHQTTHPVKPDIYSGDLTRSFEPRNLVKWKQLISGCDLSQLEIIELKQAVACVLVENDILQSRLSCARDEVHDKLRHTNGVLEDCRHHLGQCQRENMQLRVSLKEEQARNQAYTSRIADLEGSILQMKTDNQHLQQELNHTAMLLNDSLTKTQLEIYDLKSENWRLASKLGCVEENNDDLREEVELLTQKQVKAVDTMDGLRKWLARTRQEREELFDELATLKNEQRSKVKEVIKNYQEKGSQDEWQKEQNQAVKTQISAVSQVTRDLNCFHSLGRLPTRHSKSSNSPTVHDGGGKHVKRSSPGGEIDPHRRGQTYYSSNWSSHQGRSSSVPGYSCPLSMDESTIDADSQNMKQYCLQPRTNFVECAIQSSWSRLERSRSPGSRSPGSRLPGSRSPGSRSPGSYKSSVPGSFTQRKRAPVLTKQQRQYADQLVQKYTGQISYKQPA